MAFLKVKDVLLVHICVHCVSEMTAEFLTISHSMQRARKPWVKFSQDCELFSAPPLCKGVQGECRKPGYAPPPSTGAAPVHRARTESEGEGEGSHVRPASICVTHAVMVSGLTQSITLVYR